MPTKRIGVLTGGGDCPGLNAVIRAVTKTAIFDHGWDVMGIEDGVQGLIENRIRPLTADDTSNILTLGGTILGTSNRANPTKFCTGHNDDGTPIFEDVTDRCLYHAKSHKLDVVIAIGGDGTMSACRLLLDAGINVIGVPKTIDNDLWGTDLTFGFLTAVDTATESLDRLHTTAASHHRAMVCEVMGRNAGWIGLYAGIASGSDIILLPEFPFDLDVVCAAIDRRSRKGRRYSIICVSEGARAEGGEQIVDRVDPTSPDPIRLGGIGEWVANEIEKRTGQESRCATLGHVQRGGSPIAADRVLATRFGYRATTLVAEGAEGRVVAMQNGTVTDIDLREVADKQRTVPADHELIKAAKAVGTSFGIG
jgi:phosphofructokinase-like protein